MSAGAICAGCGEPAVVVCHGCGAACCALEAVVNADACPVCDRPWMDDGTARPGPHRTGWDGRTHLCLCGEIFVSGVDATEHERNGGDRMTVSPADRSSDPADGPEAVRRYLAGWPA